MISRGAGRILITASVASTMPGPFYATYAASKSFVLSFAEAVRHEVKDSGVTITALMPGPTDPNFFDRADMLDTPANEGKKDDPAVVAADGFAALLAGKDHVVAGSLKNKVQVAATGVLPDTAKAALHAKLTEPVSDVEQPQPTDETATRETIRQLDDDLAERLDVEPTGDVKG
jgi:short-subunit dehydrogenase